MAGRSSRPTYNRGARSPVPRQDAVLVFTGSLLAAEQADDGLVGLSGVAADVIAAIGELGVGLLTFVETVFPPIPSEIILPLAGYEAERGQLNVVLVVAAATVGSLLGALVLYGLGAVFGEERARRWLTWLPLVDEADFDNAAGWFHRHGHGVVFFGRFPCRSYGAWCHCQLPPSGCHSRPFSFSLRRVPRCGTPPSSVPATCWEPSTSGWSTT